MADISKITLPSGNTYDIKDAVAREMISGGVSFLVAWDGASVPVVADIPAGVVVTYQGTTYTGTLSAEDAQPGAFYLVKSATSTSGGTSDVYDEYVPVGTTGSKTWEKIGDTQVDLSDVVTDVSLSKQTDVVLGEATTFKLSSGSVAHGTPTKDAVLGEDTTFTATATGGAVTLRTVRINANASGTAVGADGTAAAVTGYPNVATDTFLKSASATTSKLVTTSITPTNGTETVSKVTKTASKLVTTSIPNVTGNTSVSIPNVTGNTSVSIPNVTSAGTASTWNFSMGSGTDAETLIITGANSTAPTLGTTLTATNTTLGTALSASKVTLGTAITAATGEVATNGTGSDIVTAVTVSDKTVAKAGTAVTVATGSVASTGTGSDIVTDVTVGTTATAVTGLGTPATSTVLTGVKVTAQPTVLITDEIPTGGVSVATGISSVTQPTITVTANTDDIVNAVTDMPTSTVGTDVTVGTNDKVTVLKNTTDVSVIKGNA